MADLGAPAPGFRIGLPTLQQRFLNSQTGTYSYMMVTPAGSRVELRQVGTSSIYESQDGSYTQLDVSNANALKVRTSDGTQLTFVPTTDVAILGFRCSEIKDRNGNYLSATHDSYGHTMMKPGIANVRQSPTIRLRPSVCPATFMSMLPMA